MKKYLIVIVGLLILLTGCLANEDNSLVKKELSDNIILSYKSNKTGLDSEPYYEIYVYADKYITYGYSNLDGFSQVNLTDEQYQEIVNYITSDNFLKLSSDISNPNAEKENYSQIVVYYNNYTNFTVSGTNIDNATYLGLVELLESYK